jgi:hypothetical protein
MNDQTHKNNRDAIYENHLTSRRQTKTQLLTIRIDVDYPYPSRLRSFIYTTLCLRAGKDYARAPFPSSSVYHDYGNPAEKESGMTPYADLGWWI